MSKSRYKRGIGRVSKQRIMFKYMFCINANVHLNWPMTSGVVFITTSYLKAWSWKKKIRQSWLWLTTNQWKKCSFFWAFDFIRYNLTLAARVDQHGWQLYDRLWYIYVIIWIFLAGISVCAVPAVAFAPVPVASIAVLRTAFAVVLHSAMSRRFRHAEQSVEPAQQRPGCPPTPQTWHEELWLKGEARLRHQDMLQYSRHPVTSRSIFHSTKGFIHIFVFGLRISVVAWPERITSLWIVEFSGDKDTLSRNETHV